MSNALAWDDTDTPRTNAPVRFRLNRIYTAGGALTGRYSTTKRDNSGLVVGRYFAERIA